MSLRRKSCDACFKGRRKCDLGFPTCATCRKTRKTCHYAYPPIHQTRSARDSPTVQTVSGATAIPSIFMSSISMTELLTAIDNSTPDSLFETGAFAAFFGHNTHLSEDGTTSSLGQSVSGISHSSALPAVESNSPSIHIYLGSLGEVQPIESSMPAWQWLIDELKSYPREFTQRTETIFLHRELYRGSLPQAIRAAYGVSSNHCLASENNQEMLFRVIDAEVLELLKPSDGTELLDELARLQAFVFYQTVRFFHGGLEQRSMAEQQQSLVMTTALKLLSRSQTEIGDSEAGNWRMWILAVYSSNCHRGILPLRYQLGLSRRHLRRTAHVSQATAVNDD